MAWNVSDYDFLLGSETAVDWSVRSERHRFGNENQNDLGWVYDSDERKFHDSGCVNYECVRYWQTNSSHTEWQRRCHLHLVHGEHFVQRLYGQYVSVSLYDCGWVFVLDLPDFDHNALARSVS